MSEPEQHSPITAEELAQAFEEEEAPADLSPYSVEDWVTMAVFWAMSVCVFLQFFTRYVLNDSYAWTEEIAINCLVVTVFLGSVWCVRMSRHIQVDILYRWLSPRPARVLSTVVDLIRIVFFVYACWLLWRYVHLVHRERMVTVDLPRWLLYYAVLAAWVLMLLRSIQVAVANWRRGYSVLERPEAFDGLTG
ncbi:TRAP transporter small permease [Amaricoccus sp.]|uniref:TRAP transporter small permease n=1 Tax=Amaricoccus sp. TaxID=1872485 RepID=UPI0026319FE7|nr:TRAP transporter small permease [Amaricoccus sp.]HRO10929.1 TRAP transporter small permease [Amaricoccus sp.]